MRFRPGDILACYGADFTSRLISWGTTDLLAPRSLQFGPSHVALICDYQSEPLWVESTTMCRTPCVVQGRLISGAQAHFPDDRIDDYVQHGGHVDLYRLSSLMSLSAAESQLLSTILVDHLVRGGIHYDLRGAIFSGTRAFQLTRLFPNADLNELFCSELVAAVAMRLQRMNHANPTRYNPARLLRELVRHGTYYRVQTLQSAHRSS